VTAARLAIDAIAELLEAGGVTASRDASGFDPAPIGVLLGLPTLVGRTLSGATSTTFRSLDRVRRSRLRADAVDRLYAEADAIAEIVSARRAIGRATWAGAPGRNRYAAIEISAIVTVSIEEG
jgi:hypothetical protein